MKRKLFTLFTTLILTLAMTVTAFAADTVTINVSDPPQVGTINVLLKKAGRYKSKYPLSGAVFEVKHYPNESGSASGTPIHTWRFVTTTFSDGTFGIDGSNPTLASGSPSALIPLGNYKHVWPLGTYTIQEITPPTSYLKSNEIKTFIVKYNNSGGQYDALVRDSAGNEFKNKGVTLTDDNIWPHDISIVKKDKDINESSPEGDAKLSGIKFALVLRSQDEYCLKDNLDRLVKKGEVVDILTTDSNGKASTKTGNLRYGTYELIELRKDSTVAVGDMYDSVSAKYGKSIYANSTGYLFNSQRATKDAFIDGAVVSYDFNDPPVRGGVSVTKKDRENTSQQGDAELSGIKFAVVNRSAAKVKVDGTVYEPGKVVKILTTDAKGEAATSNETLPYGTYDLIELKADSTIAVGDVYNSSSSKYGSSIYANAAGMRYEQYTENFTIRHQHEMVGKGTRMNDTGANETFTDNRGHLDNLVVRGGVEITKKDYDNTSEQGDATLQGIKFAIVNDSKKEVKVDGTVYAPGKVVKILTTNVEGKCSTTNETLPYGTYTAYELRRDSTVAVGDVYSSVSAKYGKSIYANSTGASGVTDNQHGSMLFASYSEKFTIRHHHEMVGMGTRLSNTGKEETFTDNRLKPNNKVDRTGIHIVKKDIEADNEQGDATLAGIKFAIVNRSRKEVKVNGTVFAPGKVIVILTTDVKGECSTAKDLLPYGTYGVYELRADSTIAVGDVYDSSSAKYGKSIYANKTGADGVDDNQHGSMLFANFSEIVRTRNQYEMAGDGTCLSDTGENMTFTDGRLRPKNRVVRGGFEAYKVDKETLISYPLEGASLAGIEFTLKNASKKRVYVNGQFYAPGATIPDAKGTKNANGDYVWITNAKGWIGCDNQYLPYGTYTLQETKTNESYHLTDNKPHTFEVRIEEQVTGKDDDSFLRTKEETAALKAKWVGGDFAKGDTVFKNQVKRGPLGFHKVNENGEKMENIPWKITNTATGETHYVITDANGRYNSEHAKHSKNTNAYDDIIKPYVEQNKPVPMSVLEAAAVMSDNDAEPERYNVGLWFSLSKDLKTEAPVDDTLGPLPYGTYTIEEVRCEANMTKELVRDTIFIFSDEGEQDRTILNENIKLETNATDNISQSNIGKIVEKDEIRDNIVYHGLYVDRKYRVHTELHYAPGEEGKKVDGGIVTDNKGNKIQKDTTFTAFTREKTDNIYMTFDSRKLYADGELLKGPDCVIFEYIYEVKDDGTEEFRTAEVDPNNKAQTIYYPWIGTTLTDKNTEIRMGLARKDMVLIDRIEYRNFPIGTKYEFEGYLVDKATGEPAVDADGKPIEATVSKRIQEKNGFVNMEFKFNGTGMDGKTLVAFEAVDGGHVSIEHFDIDDEAQNFHIPKIRTQAKDKDTQDDVGKVVGTFVDTITYENLIPGYKYKMSGDLMFKDSGKSSGQKGSKEFTAQAGTDPNRADGSITVEIPLTLTKAELEGKSLVAFEELIILPNQDDKVVTEEWLKNLPKKEEVIAEHKDINDKGQTVNYPKIRTLAVDSKTADHVGTVEDNAQVLDTVEYWNLVPGREYTIKGTLRDADSGEVLATAKDLTFTATEADAKTGKKVIQFSINSSKLDGHTVVVYEKLIHNNVEVTQHEENNDETQRVHYPWMSTTAIDSQTRDHVGTILGKLKNVYRRLTGEDVADTVYQKVIDKVEYKNTLPNETYVISGTLMNKETGKPILGDDGKPITSSGTLKAGSHQADGSIDITFSVDSSKLENVTIVCYEKMLHQNPVTKEDIEVNRHEDINDEEQSVHDVEIHTTAIDETTGDHVGYTRGNTVISDAVEMKNLVNGMEYTLKGTLYNKETGEKLTDANGKPYTAELTFTAQGSGSNKRVDATKTLKFTVDGTKLEDVTAVAFEDLYHNNVRITTHSDLNDEAQSVHFPKVLTSGHDSKTKDHVGTVSKKEAIIDTVRLNNLVPGMKYIVSGKLMIQGTTNPLLDANGKEITAEKEFTADAEDMTIELAFPEMDTTIYRDKTAVVFEKLYHPYNNTGDRVEVAHHEEPNDEGQSVHYPDIRTHAIDNETGGHVGNITKTAKVRDKVALKNLIPGMKYTVKGVLHFKNDVTDASGKVIYKKGDVVKMNGNDVTAEKSFTAEAANEDHILEFSLDSTLLEGATVVAFEKLYHPENNVGTLVEVVQHEDIDDEEQSVHYPRIGTIASDGLTADHVGATEKNTIKDTVEYWNLIPGQKYKLKGTVMNKNTGEPIKIDGKTVETDSGWFTAETEHGTKDIVFDIDASALDGETVVCYEKLFTPEETEWTDTDKEPIVEVEITNHEDLTDEDQSVHYPKVTTNARDSKTDDHVGTVENGAQVKDTVTLENLIPGQQYTVRGVLMKFGTTQPVLVDGKKITATKTITATEENMTIELEFEKYDSAVVRGETTVCFEYLYHPNAETGEDVEVATHEVPDEEAQSVHYPKIRTVATDSRTGDHVGSIFGKLINTFRRLLGQEVADTDFAGIIDNVEYKNLIPGEEYIIEGKLMNKETGEEITDENGKVITATATVEAGHPADGNINLYFDIDTSRYENVTVVCFEKLKHKNPKTEELIEVDRHEDLTDEDQSVHEVEIRTTAVDQHVALPGHEDKHTADATGKTVIDDAVQLHNLVNGMSYTLVGTLHYKDDGSEVLDASGKPYTTTVPFTVNVDSEEKRVDDVVHVIFEVDGKALEGRTVVTFEELYHNDVLVTTHADVNDEAQTVYFPWIRTNATDNKNGAKETQINEKTEIIDKVYFRNLLPGKYRLSGVLMDKDTNKEILDAAGNTVTQTLEFTIETKEEGKEGYKDLIFTFDSSLLRSHIAVAFETLTLLDELDAEYEVPVAEHKDINDEKQSEWIIDIETNLTDVMTNSDEGEARAEAEWSDHVSYWGLIPGKEYIMKGVLMDKETNEPFVDANGETITGEVRFTPETKDGSVDIPFKGDSTGLAGKKVVAFEELYPSDLPDTVIAEHKDINDDDQTVDIIEIRTHATDKSTNINEGMASEESTIIDRVTYKNLVVGREYILKAKMMDKKTGKPVMVNGAEVTQTVRFTPGADTGLEEPEVTEEQPAVEQTEPIAEEPVVPAVQQRQTVDGYVDVVFLVDTSALAGETMVAYEQLFNAEFEDVMIAHHEDINDEEQAIHIPAVKTVAELSNKNVMDEVTYFNLVPGEYIARGWLVDKETGKKLKESDGEAAFKLDEFTKKGAVTVELPVNGYERLGGYNLVAFEEIYVITTDENGDEVEVLVAEHKDVEDEAQTVEIPKTPKTGDSRAIFFLTLAFMLSVLLAFIVRKIRFNR